MHLQLVRRASSLAFVIVSMVIGCSDAPPTSAQVRLDDFGDTLAIPALAPARIVSLNPSATELLYAIGAGARVVGRTTYDALPVAVRAVQDLGPGLHPNVEAVIDARPDLVVLYASADNREASRKLRAAGIATAAYRMDRIADFSRIALSLGALVHDSAAAERTVDSVMATLAAVRAATAPLPTSSVAWPLWESPLIVVGGGSFLDELVTIAGGRNVFGALPQPSPQVTWEAVLQADPDVVLGGPTSAPRLARDVRWQGLRAVRMGRVVVVDTLIATGPSPRVGQSAWALARVLHPAAGF